MIDEVLNEADSELDTDSVIYNPSFSSNGYTSIASYKTEKSINSRKSRYNALPRRKYTGIGQRKLSQGLVSEEVDEASASVSKVCRSIGCLVTTTSAFKGRLSDETFSSLLRTIPISFKANFVEGSRPNLGANPLDLPLKIHGSSIYGLSIVV